MRYIEKTQPANDVQEQLLRYRQARASWSKLEPALRTALHQSLALEQKGLCAYTEELLNRDKTIEHLRPRNPPGGPDYQRTWDYDNLLLVHQLKSYGESGKGNQFDESLFLSPLNQTDCAELQFSPTGEITAPRVPKRFGYTDSLLNLNHSKLKEGRANLWRALELSVSGGLTAEQIHDWLQLDDSGYYRQSYPSVVEAFLHTMN